MNMRARRVWGLAAKQRRESSYNIQNLEERHCRQIASCQERSALRAENGGVPDRIELSRMLTHDQVAWRIVRSYSSLVICAKAWPEKPNFAASSIAICTMHQQG